MEPPVSTNTRESYITWSLNMNYSNTFNNQSAWHHLDCDIDNHVLPSLDVYRRCHYGRQGKIINDNDIYTIVLTYMIYSDPQTARHASNQLCSVKFS